MPELPQKKTVRTEVWSAIQNARAGRFPGILGRIPNFKGAERACELLATSPLFDKAQFIKSNPDSPQRKLRHLALVEGKKLYLAVPKLAHIKPFLEIDPSQLHEKELWHASSIKGSFEYGRPISIEDMPKIDLIITGCVGVTSVGARLGKGGGYADLEYALLRQFEKVDEGTPVVTVVHPAQILEDHSFPMLEHDTSIDMYATPSEVFRCKRSYARPSGIYKDALEKEKIDAIPVLRRYLLGKNL